VTLVRVVRNGRSASPIESEDVLPVNLHAVSRSQNLIDPLSLTFRTVVIVRTSTNLHLECSSVEQPFHRQARAAGRVERNEPVRKLVALMVHFSGAHRKARPLSAQPFGKRLHPHGRHLCFSRNSSEL